MRRAHPLRHATPILAAAIFAGGVATASAQGTEAQRRACTPDAIRLCPDTIPDAESTKACMRAHEAELSPTCRQAFADAAQAPPTASAPPPPAATPAPQPSAPVEAAPPAPRRAARADFRYGRGDADLRRAKRVMGHLCASQVFGAETCDFTAQMMRLAE